MALAISACAVAVIPLRCIEVSEADCVTARDVASKVVGVDPLSSIVEVRRYRPDFEIIGKPNPEFAAYVSISQTANGKASVVLVMRLSVGDTMTGQLVTP